MIRNSRGDLRAKASAKGKITPDKQSPLPVDKGRQGQKKEGPSQEGQKTGGEKKKIHSLTPKKDVTALRRNAKIKKRRAFFERGNKHRESILSPKIKRVDRA